MKISTSKSDRLSPISQLGGLQALTQVLESIPSHSSLPHVLDQPTSSSYTEQSLSPRLPNSQQLQEQLLASLPRQENLEEYIWHQDKNETRNNSQQNARDIVDSQRATARISLRNKNVENLQCEPNKDSEFSREQNHEFSSLSQNDIQTSIGSSYTTADSSHKTGNKVIKGNKSGKGKGKVQKGQSRLAKKGQKIKQLLSDRSKEEENGDGNIDKDIADNVSQISMVNPNNSTSSDNSQLYASNLMRKVVIQDMLLNNKQTDLQITQTGNQFTSVPCSGGLLPSIYPLQLLSGNSIRHLPETGTSFTGMLTTSNGNQFLPGNTLTGIPSVSGFHSTTQPVNRSTGLSVSSSLPQTQGTSLCALNHPAGNNNLELSTGTIGIHQPISSNLPQSSSCLSQMSPGSLSAVTTLLSQLINSDTNQQSETVAINKTFPHSAAQNVNKDGNGTGSSDVTLPTNEQQDISKDQQKSLNSTNLSSDALLSLIQSSLQTQSSVPQGPLLIPLNQCGSQNPENSVVTYQQLQAVLSSLISGLQGQLDATQRLIPPLLGSTLQQKQGTSATNLTIPMNNSNQMSDVPYTCVPISPNKEVQVGNSLSEQLNNHSAIGGNQLNGQGNRNLGNQLNIPTNSDSGNQLNDIPNRSIENQFGVNNVVDERGLAADNHVFIPNAEDRLVEDSFLPQQTEHLYDEQNFLYKTNMEPYLHTRGENSAVAMENVDKGMLSNQVGMDLSGCQDVFDQNSQKNQMLLSHDSEEDLTNVPNMFKQYCLSCKAALLNDDCQFHKISYNHIKDTPILSKARTSIPSCLALQPTSTFGNYNVYLGVWTKENIPAHTKFGPLVGKMTKETDSKDEKVPCFPGWKIFLDTRSETIDMCDENECNWMMFIKPARCEKTQNLIAHQLGHHIYFFTTKEVFCGQELLYWFSKEYASLSALPLLASQASLSECLICGKVFTDKTTRKLHMKEHPHYQKYKCHICDHLYSSLSSLNRHTMIHMGVKPHVCHVCHKTFTDNSNLKVHLKLHTGMKLFECDICGKSFRQKAHLKTHMVIHTGKKNLKCYFCDKTFAREGDRKQHEYQHTKEKSFECEECGKVFYKLQNYKCHLLIHTGVRDFECQFCMKSFGRKFHLQRHMEKCQAKNEIFEEKDLILNNVDLKGILNSQ